MVALEIRHKPLMRYEGSSTGATAVAVYHNSLFRVCAHTERQQRRRCRRLREGPHTCRAILRICVCGFAFLVPTLCVRFWCDTGAPLASIPFLSRFWRRRYHDPLAETVLTVVGSNPPIIGIHAPTRTKNRRFQERVPDLF